jgi:predicted RNA-binding Zn ribbon-like protein
VSIEFANTVFAVRGRPTEGLESPEALARWLRDVGFPVDDVTRSDLDAARTLRAAIRTIARAITQCQEWDAEAVATVNACAASPPRWRELIIERAAGPGIAGRSGGTPVETALGEIADNAIDIFGGPSRADLRGCPGPNCILFFLTDGRREWCSKSCGNRARAARHYARTRRTGEAGRHLD